MNSKNSYNTYFICATQTGNLGDLMINKMLVDELCKYGKVYIDVYGVPEDFKLPLLSCSNVVDVSSFNFSVKRLSVKNLFCFISFMKRYNIRLITRSPGPLSEPSLKVRLGFSLINCLARLYKTKVVYLGNCCSQAYANRTKLKNTYMNEIYVRSQCSVEYAKKFFSCPVHYIPDLAFLMAKRKVYDKRKTVIVDYRMVSDKMEKTIADLKSILHDFRLLGYEIELYYQVKSDKEEIFRLYEKLKGENVKIREEILWFNEIESFYSNKSFVISNRLHSLLFGAAYGVIPIARISDDSRVAKIEHVFKSSLPEIFCKNINIRNCIDVADFVENECFYRDTLLENMTRNKLLCSDIIETLCRNV